MLLGIVQEVKHGLELFTVIFTTDIEVCFKTFWSEQHARQFVARKYPELNISKLSITGTKDIKNVK